MSPGTVREYVVRLRRLGNHLTALKISRDLLSGEPDETLAPWLPSTSTNNYRIALRKYSQYKGLSPVVEIQKFAYQATSDIY